MNIKENHSLKNHNTFGVDVKAKFYCEINTEDELIELLSDSKYEALPKFIMGGGSNILFTKNYDGLIINNRIKGIKIVEEDENSAIIEASAGENWDDFVNYCVNHNLYGVENLSLIPGNVGAAPIQNIGAYGVELKDVFVSSRGIYLDNAEQEMIYLDQCKFGYRDSIFKNELRNRFVVTSILLKLGKQKHFNIKYPLLKSSLENIHPEEITLSMVRDKVIYVRKSKLPDPKVLGNAGSFFKNPIVTFDKIEEIQKKYSGLAFYELGNGNFKIPAGWLIEKCGWKGKKVGNVGCYENQALIIVNYGNAKPEEILKFSNDIVSSVHSEFRIELIPEVNII